MNQLIKSQKPRPNSIAQIISHLSVKFDIGKQILHALAIPLEIMIPYISLFPFWINDT